MQKKVLIPVLMAVPAALPAMADVDMGFPVDNWKQGGTTGDENDFTTTSQDFTCVPGTAYLGQEMTLPNGKYKIEFTKKDNIKVLVGETFDGKNFDTLTEKEIQSVATDSSFWAEFEVTGGKAYIMIAPEDPALGFSFTGKQISLLFNETAATAYLTAQLNGLTGTTLLEVAAEDYFQQAKDLHNRLTKIQGDLKSYSGTPFETISSEISSIGGTATKQKSIEIYQKYGLDKDPSAIAEYLITLGKTIEKYNEDVKKEKAIWQVYLDNVAARENLLNEQSTLANNIAAARDEINNWKVDGDDVKADILKKANDLAAEINAYKDAINAEYPLEKNPEALREEIKFESRAAELQAKIGALNLELAALKADYNAYYNVNFLLTNDLTNAYNAYIKAVNSALGIRGYETVYDEEKTGKTNDATVFYNETKNKFVIPKVEGAVAYDNEKGCAAGMQAAIDKFKADTKAYNNMVATQNENMTIAVGQIGEFYGDIAAFNEVRVPSQFRDEFTKKLNAVKDAVNALRTYVDGEYAKHELSVEATSEYGTQVADIQKLIDDLNDFIKPFATVNTLWNNMNDAWEKIQEISKTTREAVPGHEVDIKRMFYGNFKGENGFEDAIESLNSETAVDQTVVDALQKQIDNTVKNAQDMSDYFIQAYKAISGYQASLDELVKFVENKEIEEVASVENLRKLFKETYTNDGAQFPKEISLLWSKYDEAANLGPNEAWDMIQDFCKSFETSTLSSDMNDAKVKFAGEATDANMTYADAEFAKLQVDWEKASKDGVTNIDKVVLDTVGAELCTIKTNIAVAKSATNPAAALAECDQDIIKALKTISDLSKQINDLIDNQQAYDELMGLVNGLQTQLDAVKEYNKDNSLEPGKAYYENTVIPAIQAKIDQLNITDLPTALKKNTVVADRAGENGFDKRIEALGNEISDTRLAIERNNTAHTNQLTREKEVRKYIEELIADIKSNENAAGLGQVTTWVNELQSLIDNDIVKVNNRVTNSYGKGYSYDDNKAIMDAYDEIYKNANEIARGYHGDAFHDAVVDANETTTVGWEQIVNGLWDQYKDGIGTYNIFHFDLKNPGWRAFAIATVERHATLFEFYNIITNLNNEEADAVAAWNAANHVITPEEWQEWLDKANGVSLDITADVNGLLAETDALAVQYYGQLEPKAKAAIEEATALLLDADISLENLDKANFNYNQAVDLYNDNKVEPHVSIRMDEIADYLDAVLTSIDLQTYAETAWADKYLNAQNDINVLREEIEGYTHAEPVVKDAALQGFAETVETIEALNAEVAAVKEDLINRYKGDVESLDALLDTLRSLRDEVKKSNDLNVEDQQLQNNFDNVWLPQMNDAYEDLREYCETLGGCASMETMLAQIRSSIDVIRELVANHGGRLVELNLENRCNSVINSINDAYKTAFNYEVTYLRQLLKDTKVAFNDAVKNDGKLPENVTFDTVDVQIEALNSKIEVLRYNEAEKDALHAEALGYENELCSLFVMLQSSWSESNPATDILNTLNGRYDAIAQAIASGEELLGGCLDSVKTEFAGKYGELKSALDAEKSDWSDDGDHIVARETYYINALTEIEAEVNALTESIRVAEEAAQAEAEKQRVSNERYDVLKAEFDALNRQFEESKVLVESYGEDIAELYSTTADYIESELAKTLNKLEADKASYSLTADSELENAEYILGLIKNYKLNATRYYAGIVLDATGAAAKEASTKLKDLKIVPADRVVLEKQYNDANIEYRDLLNEMGKAGFERLGEIITRAGELTEIFNSISENAVANSFVPGDVDLDENGEVNVLDVQMLINMIGKGVTYQELYAENARQACAADVTGNQNLNVADVTALIQIILGDDFNVVKVRAHKPAAKVDGGLSLTLVEEGDGVRRYALMLNGGVPFTGGQFDIRVSGTANVTAVATSDRTEAHDAHLFDRGLGDYRVLLASMENAVFEGNEGVIVFIDVEGDGELTVENALFSDTNNIEHEMGRAHTSAVDAIIDYCKDGVKRIYDAAGRKFNSLQHGINIIINKDGSVKKELRK